MRHCLAVSAMLLCASCDTIPDVDDMVIAEPVNCETAQRDLVALEQMRPKAGRTVLLTAYTIWPTGLLVALLSDDMEDRGRVFNGSYAQELATKKAQIRATCKISGSSVSE